MRDTELHELAQHLFQAGLGVMPEEIPHDGRLALVGLVDLQPVDEGLQIRRALEDMNDIDARVVAQRQIRGELPGRGRAIREVGRQQYAPNSFHDPVPLSYQRGR